MSQHPGSLKIASIGGVEVFVHRSFPAILVLPFFFTGFRWLESLCYGLAVAFLVAAHELGHVAAAKAYRLKVHSLEISGFGGHCRIQVPRAMWDTWWLFSAGLWVQVFLLLLTWFSVAVWGPPSTILGRSVVNTFVFWNLWIMLINIIPRTTMLGPNDGKVLWQLLLHATRGQLHPFPTRVFPPETPLLSIGEFTPEGFKVGIEVLNDDATPMEWVVDVLTNHLGLTHEEALQKMLEIHRRGGALFSIDGFDKAKQIASAVMEQGRLKGHPLVVRAVKIAS